VRRRGPNRRTTDPCPTGDRQGRNAVGRATPPVAQRTPGLRSIEIHPRWRRLGPFAVAPRGRIHVHAALCERSINHSAVADRDAGNAVPAPRNGTLTLVFAREFHGPQLATSATTRAGDIIGGRRRSSRFDSLRAASYASSRNVVVRPARWISSRPTPALTSGSFPAPADAVSLRFCHVTIL